MNYWPYLKLGDVEIANSQRTLQYLLDGLAGPGFDVALAPDTGATYEGTPFYGYGHSYMRSIVPYSTVDLALVADALGGIAVNASVGGFKMIEAATAAWQERGVISRPNGTINGGPDGNTYPVAVPYPVGVGGVMLIDCELNDGAALGNVAKAVSGFSHALRTLLALSQARSRQEHSTFTYVGAWVDTEEVAGTAIDSNHYSVAAGSTCTIEFGGESCYLLGFTSDSLVAGAYGSFDVEVDGVHYGTWAQTNGMLHYTSQDPVDPVSVDWGPMAYKISGLAAGTHTIVLTANDSNPTLIKALLTPSPYPAVAIVMKDSLTDDAYNYLPGAKAAYDAAIDTVVAEFPNAIAIDPDLASVPYDAATMTYDGVHPTAAGHEVLADAILERMPAAPILPRRLACYCSTVSQGPYTAPDLDPAPWFDPAIDASADFLGMVPDVDVLPVLSRRVGKRATGGANIGPVVPGVRTVQVSGHVFASSAIGMSYGIRWLNRALAGSTSGCAVDTLTVLPACDPSPLVTEEVVSTETGGVLIKDVDGSNLHTADTAALSITGDIDIRVAVALDSWTRLQVVVSKWVTGTQGSYSLQIEADTKISLIWTPDGTDGSATGATSTAGITDGYPGTLHIIRATADVDDGAGHHVVKFYKKPTTPDTAEVDADDNTGWVQIGATVTVAGASAIFNGTASLLLGNFASGLYPAPGIYYALVVKSGIDGTAVSDADFAHATALPLVENGNSWSASGSAALIGPEATFSEEQSRDLRDLANAGLIDPPVFTDEGKVGACLVQKVAFQFAAGSPWLRRAFTSPTLALDDAVKINFATIAGEALMDASAAVITITAGSGTVDGVVIEGRVGDCVQTGTADISYTVNSLPAGYTLVIDASLGSVIVYNASGEVVGGFDYLLFTGLFEWLYAAPGTSLCVSVDASTATGLSGATLDIERVDLEA